MYCNNRTLIATLFGLFIAIIQAQSSPLLRGRKQGENQDQMAKAEQGGAPFRGINVKGNNTKVYLETESVSRNMTSKKRAAQGRGNNNKKNRNKKAKRKNNNKKPLSSSGPNSDPNTGASVDIDNNQGNENSGRENISRHSPTSKPTRSPTSKATNNGEGQGGNRPNNNKEDESRNKIERDPYWEEEGGHEVTTPQEPEPVQGKNPGKNSPANSNIDYYEYGWWWFKPSSTPNPTSPPTQIRAGRVDAITNPEPIQGDHSGDNSTDKNKNKKKKKNTDYYGWWWGTNSPTPSPSSIMETPTQARSDHVNGWEDYWRNDSSDEDGSRDYISEDNGRSGGANQNPIKEDPEDLDYYGWWWFHV